MYTRIVPKMYAGLLGMFRRRARLLIVPVHDMYTRSVPEMNAGLLGVFRRATRLPGVFWG